MVAYLGSLFVLLLSAFWQTDEFTSEVVHTFTLDNFRTLIERDVYREVAWRTISMAGLVTIADACSPSRSRTTWRASRRRASATCSSSRS